MRSTFPAVVAVLLATFPKVFVRGTTRSSRYGMSVCTSFAGARTFSLLASRCTTVDRRRVSPPLPLRARASARVNSPDLGPCMLKRSGGRVISGRGAHARRVSSSTADLESGGGEDPAPMLAPLDDDAVMRRVLPAVLVATLGAFSFGYHLGIVNPALEHLAKDLGIASNVQLKGLVVSMVLVGATAGSLVAGKLADGFGRKKRSRRRAPPRRLVPVFVRARVETMSSAGYCTASESARPPTSSRCTSRRCLRRKFAASSAR